MFCCVVTDFIVYQKVVKAVCFCEFWRLWGPEQNFKLWFCTGTETILVLSPRSGEFFEDIENTLYLDVFLIELFFCIVFLCSRTANDIVIGITLFRPGLTRGKAYKCWIGGALIHWPSNSCTSNSFRIPAQRIHQVEGLYMSFRGKKRSLFCTRTLCGSFSQLRRS